MWNNPCLTLHFFLIEKLLSGLLQFLYGGCRLVSGNECTWGSSVVFFKSCAEIFGVRIAGEVGYSTQRVGLIVKALLPASVKRGANSPPF